MAQRNAYLNIHYGYHLSPATARPPRWVSTERRQRWDKLVGFVPYAGEAGRLLDVGCSNGGFLMQMRKVGWNVCGVEPDPKAAAHAAAAGLDVRVGLLESAGWPEAHFDAITLNHVIEHLHRPRITLQECFRILKPGGIISLSTPNLQSLGHCLFGGDWFGLEPPRHLVVFTPRSLRLALESCGFQPEPSIRLRLISNRIFKRSMHLRIGSDPIREKPRLPVVMRLKAAWWSWWADRQSLHRPDSTEELVLLARRLATA